MTRFVVFYLSMLAAAFVLGRLAGVPSLFTPPPTPTRLVVPLLLAVVLGLGVVEVGRRLEARAWYRDMALVLRRMLTSRELLGGKLDLGTAFVVAVYSSIAEEALFRGVVQPWLAAGAARWLDAAPDALGPLAVGVAGSTALFGLLHLPVLPELRPWTAFAVVVGLMFGGLAAASGSLLAPIVAHLIVNWMNLLRLAKLEPGPA